VKKISCSLILGTLLLVTGCASIVSGTTQPISFNSTPIGARVLINGADMGKTPLTLELKRKQSYAVAINLDGYKPETMNIERGLNGWVWGNIIFGGLIGVVVDAASGSMYKLTPDQFTAVMGHDLSMDSGEGGMVIAFTMTPDASWEKIGQLETN
jgi:uncharacterized protein YceK